MAEDKNKQNEEVELLDGEAVEEVNASEEFLEKNLKQITSMVVALFVIIGGVTYFYTSSGDAELEDQKKIFRAQYYFGLDSNEIALFGDTSGKVNAELIGFDELASDLESSKVKNLNNFYIGVLNLKNGEYAIAVEYLSDFSSGDELLQARAKSLLGDAYMELAETDESNYSKAISAYKEASSLKSNEGFTPVYLMKLALAYELGGDDAKAIETYGKIINTYKPNVAEVTEAKKYKAVLESKTKS